MNKTNNELLIRVTTDGFSHKADWVKQAADGSTYETVRIPEQKVTEYKAGDSFIMAGKEYKSLSELKNETVNIEKGVYRDIYGRTVIEAEEKFPCFDSYDYAYEKRYFHWLFIREESTLHCYYHADERDEAKVMEDVSSIPHDAFKDLKRMGYCEEREESILKF